MDYDYNDDFFKLDFEERPLVKKIILPTNLWLKALEIGRKTHNEVGFFIIGLFKGKICYVYDLIEFDYTEQSGAFIETGIKKAARLRAGLPVGLSIVGNMHKHPGFLQYSNTDRRDYLLYGRGGLQNAFIIYIVDPYDGVAGYTATEDKIHKVEVEIRDLELNEKLIKKNISLKINIEMYIQESESIKDMKFRFIDHLSSEILKNFSRSFFFENNIKISNSLFVNEISENLNIRPKKPIFIKNIGFNDEILIRIFLDSSNTLYELKEILSHLVKIQENDIYKIKFIENGIILPNNTLISEINAPLEWIIERKPIKFNFKFFKELNEFILNIYITNIYGWEV
ncbi:MAG: hypothetical protein ACTSPY_17185 [Candidatus Helarchaeota archaeon]